MFARATRNKGGALTEDRTEPAQGPLHRTALDRQLEQAGRGDRHAFEHVYRLSSAKLLAVCLRILPRGHEAEDALQDAYLTIWQRASRYDVARGPALAWLTVITRNAAIDRLRRRRPLASASSSIDEIADPSLPADSDLIAREDDVRLIASLDGLDPSDAEFLRTAFFGGMTYADLAKRERLPLGTVKSRVRRALLKLRERLA